MNPLKAFFQLSSGILFAAISLSAQDPSGVKSTLPDWLDLGVEARSRTEYRSNIGNREERDDTINWTRLRLSVDVEAASWMRFRFQGQDSRVAGLASYRSRSNTDYFDVREAYVSLGPADGSQLNIGRQALRYGADRLIGRRNWNDVDPGWDAARAVLRHGEDQVDIFSMAFVEAEEDSFDKPVQGPRLHGFYGRIRSWVPGGQVEPYVIYASQPRFNGIQDRGPDSGSYTAGVRFAGTANPWLDYDFELTGQRGHARQIELSGWASAASVRVGNDALPLRSRFLVLHDYASGDDGRDAGRQTVFDPLHHARHAHLGIGDVVGRRNISALTLGWEGYPRPDWRLRVNWLDFWLASRYDGLYGINGRIATAAPAEGAASRSVGSEWDVTLRVPTPLEGFTVEGGTALFYPHQFLKEAEGEFSRTKMVYLSLEFEL